MVRFYKNIITTIPNAVTTLIIPLFLHKLSTVSDILKAHFPNITDHQQKQFAQLEGLYKEWNAQINVISRKDIEELYTRHVLHSLES